MALQLPSDTDTFSAYPGDTVHTDVSLALRLVDGFTGGGPIGRVIVTIGETGLKAVTNPSGYHVFTNLPEGKSYDIHIHSELYFPENIDAVAIPRPDPKNPVEQVTLKPRPAYPFPGNATLVRGVIVNPDPVAGATVTSSDSPQEARTDERGEFVLYFKGIKEKDVTITVDDQINRTVQTKIREGRTVSVGKIDVGN